MSVTLKGVHSSWPSSPCYLNSINLTLNPDQKYGLVGPNGSGKSTLLRLIEGHLDPLEGQIERKLTLASFQQFEEAPLVTVETYLEDLWFQADSQNRETILALQERLNFELVCSHLSGGEWMKVRLLKLLSYDADFYLFDEPTNHLDSEARQIFYRFIRQLRQGALIVSHDRELLRYVDTVLELSHQGLHQYGGNWDFYKEVRDQERALLNHKLKRSRLELKKQERHNQNQRKSQEKRIQRGKKQATTRGLSRIEIGAKKRQAQATLGSVIARNKISDQEHREQLDAAYETLKTDAAMYGLKLEAHLPNTKLVFEAEDLNLKWKTSAHPFWKENLDISLRGPFRLHLRGNNGSGKSTLLRLLAGENVKDLELSGSLKRGSLSVSYLDQDLNSLRNDLTVLENVQAVATSAVEHLRNQLAYFLFQGDKVLQKASSLSGGEKFRLALAQVFLASDKTQLLILDEPTNNLDLANIEFLEKFLLDYKGALVLVSHDKDFLDQVRPTHFVHLRA